MRFLLLLVIFVAIPLFECYRFVRQSPYRYRVERSIPAEENYRVARSPGSKGYRAAPGYRYRIHRSADDDDSSPEAFVEAKSVEVSSGENYRFARSPGSSGYRAAPGNGYRVHRSINDGDSSSPQIITEDQQLSASNSYRNNNAYRYSIIEADANPPPASESNESPPDCSSGDRKNQRNCLQAFLDKKSIQLIDSKYLPSFSYLYQNFFNDGYDRNKQEYEDFIQCLNKKDVPEKCFYLTNMQKLSKYPEDAKNYTEFFNTIDFLYKNSDADNSLRCEIKDSVFCGIETATNSCETFQKLVDCFMFLYDNEPCPTDFREDFCHLITTDVIKDEYIPSECFTQIDSSCSHATSIKPQFYSSLLTVLFMYLLFTD